MKKDFGVKTWLYPMPVLMIATYNEDGSPNVMDAARGPSLVFLLPQHAEIWYNLVPFKTR